MARSQQKCREDGPDRRAKIAVDYARCIEFSTAFELTVCVVSRGAQRYVGEAIDEFGFHQNEHTH